MILMNKAQKNIEKSDAAGNAIFNTPYTVDSKLIELEVYVLDGLAQTSSSW